MKFCFQIYSEIVSPSDFVIVAWTHAYSFLRLMVFYFELVKLSMNLGNIGSLKFSFGLMHGLLYSFLTQIFLQWAGLEKEYRKQNRGMNIVKIVDKVDKEAENLTRGR